MDVWQNNLDIEMAKIRSVVQQYPYIAMVNFVFLCGMKSVHHVYHLCKADIVFNDLYLCVCVSVYVCA